MRKKNQISDCEYQERHKTLLKGSFNMQLKPLRSLNTATMKRRALKRQAAGNSGFAKPDTVTSR